MTEDHGAFGVKGTGDTSGYGGLVRTSAHPGSTERPYGGYFDEIADELERAYPEFSDDIERVVIDRGELTLHIKAERLFHVAQVLRDNPALRFEFVLVLTAHIIQKIRVASYMLFIRFSQ